MNKNKEKILFVEHIDSSYNLQIDRFRSSYHCIFSNPMYKVFCEKPKQHFCTIFYNLTYMRKMDIYNTSTIKSPIKAYAMRDGSFKSDLIYILDKHNINDFVSQILFEVLKNTYTRSKFEIIKEVQIFTMRIPIFDKGVILPFGIIVAFQQFMEEAIEFLESEFNNYAFSNKGEYSIKQYKMAIFLLSERLSLRFDDEDWEYWIHKSKCY